MNLIGHVLTPLSQVSLKYLRKSFDWDNSKLIVTLFFQIQLGPLKPGTFSRTFFEKDGRVTERCVFVKKIRNKFRTKFLFFSFFLNFCNKKTCPFLLLLCFVWFCLVLLSRRIGVKSWRGIETRRPRANQPPINERPPASFPPSPTIYIVFIRVQFILFAFFV